MPRSFICLFVFAVTIQIGSFDPKPLDHLTVNLNVDDSPKGITEEGDEEDYKDLNDCQMEVSVKEPCYCGTLVRDICEQGTMCVPGMAGVAISLPIGKTCVDVRVLTWEQTKSDDCWLDCGKKGGACPSFCGSNGYCCRKGYDDCPPEAGEASPIEHTCVKEKVCNGQDSGCCTSSHPCGADEGDCDLDSDCEPGLVCGKDNCSKKSGANWDKTDDCCARPKDSEKLMPVECIGCFNNQARQKLYENEIKNIRNNNSYTNCKYECLSEFRESNYVGLENGYKCYCGRESPFNYPHKRLHPQEEDSLCDEYNCTGESTTTCGGTRHIKVCKISP